MQAVLGEIVFVGNAIEARDIRLLYANQVAAVLDLAANEAPACLGRDHIYVRVPILDGEGNGDRELELAILTLVQLIRSGVKTLVACSAGMSRSPSIAAAAMALATNRTLDDCIASVTSHGPSDLSPALWNQVRKVYRNLAQKQLLG